MVLIQKFYEQKYQEMGLTKTKLIFSLIFSLQEKKKSKPVPFGQNVPLTLFIYLSVHMLIYIQNCIKKNHMAMYGYITNIVNGSLSFLYPIITVLGKEVGGFSPTLPLV